ncbi:efflux RND transporter periplasmic adaptor subunit [soil metagenome]
MTIAIVVASFLPIGCSKPPQAQSAGERPSPGVSVAEAQVRDVPVYIDEIGRIVASEVVSIQSQASGRITEIHFKDGSDVKRDQMLFTIDPRPYQAALERAQADLQQNTATLSLMRGEFERVKGMVESKALSREEFEQRQNGVAVSEAQVASAQAAIDTAKVNLDYCFIKSPIDGRAGQRLVDLGNIVNPMSNQPLLVIQKLDPIYADFTITESRLPDVRKHMRDHTLKTLVWVPEESAGGIAPHEGDLTFLNNSVQETTGTVKLRATLQNADHHFWPNQFVNIRLILEMKKDAVLVPETAVQIGQQGPFVFVVSKSEKGAIAEIRPVSVGQKHAENVVIESGLKSGETVVITGQMMVNPGGKVMVMPSAPPPPGAPGAAPSSGPSTAPSGAAASSPAP